MTLKYPKQQSSGLTEPNFLLTKKVFATLLRQPQGSYVGGIWVDAAPTSIQIEVNIQPLKGHELMSLPESDRSREWVKFYTTSVVLGVQEGEAAAQPDMLVWDGKTYEVSKVFSYKMGVLNHNKVIAARIPKSAGE